jgi:hypothetical protein
MIIDMSDVMEAIMEGEDFGITRMTMSMDSFNFGTAPVVTLPAGAADAIEPVM